MRVSASSVPVLSCLRRVPYGFIPARLEISQDCRWVVDIVRNHNHLRRDLTWVQSQSLHAAFRASCPS